MMKLLPSLAAIFLSAFGSVALAIPMMPEKIPVKQLVKMGDTLVQKQPDNAEAHYTLARIHYFAFVGGAQTLQAYTKFPERPTPTIEPFAKFTTPIDLALHEEARRRAVKELNLKEEPPSWERSEAIRKQLIKSDWHPEIADTDAAAHIQKAVEEFRTAQRLAPKNALYRLGFASLLEQARAWSQRKAEADGPELIRKLTLKDIREEYFKAWELEVSADLKDKENRGMFSPMDMVSYEAGKAYVRLAETAGDNLSAHEKKVLERIQKSLEKLDDRRMHAVTPVVFATRPVETLAELLAPETTVYFPLRGWGPHGHWPWVKPDTALLVWNPSRSGCVQSGAQLFGSYTWELFWKTGYEPLAVLDADGDGTLRGAELDGLAAWFDRNSNGVSDPGEVQPLAEIGVSAIATRATTAEGRHPMNPRGVTFADGRVLPTWDWIAEPVSQTQHGEFSVARRFTAK